jgi:hypothetical protein
MILLRIPSETGGDGGAKFGKRLAHQLRDARKRFGLEGRFAIIVDLDTNKRAGTSALSTHMMGEHEDLQTALRQLKIQETQVQIDGIKRELERAGNTQKTELLNKRVSKSEAELASMKQGKLPEISKYSDLADLPCILVLCEKGKMGDTFPRSLRFFDLRLRYANPAENSIFRAPVEQDLGRGFGYDKRDDLYPMPVILVPTTCFDKLRRKRGDRLGLLRFAPDCKMQRPKGPQTYPEDEADLEVYRQWHAGSKHFDSQWSAEEPCTTLQATAERQNPRRFLLIGRPQIGKTGAFLHLAYLLWHELGEPALDTVHEEPVSDISSSDIDDDFSSDIEDDDPAIARPKYPVHKALAGQEWRSVGHRWGSSVPHAGKYGDPANPELYNHFVVEHQREAPQNVEQLGRGSTKKESAANQGTGNHTQSGPVATPSSARVPTSNRPKCVPQTSVAKHIARDSTCVHNTERTSYKVYEPSCGGRCSTCGLASELLCTGSISQNTTKAFGAGMLL